MQPTFAIAIKDANGIPNITKQFATYEALLEFVQTSSENAPVIMALVQQEGSLSFSLVPIAIIKPGISMLNEVPAVKVLEPTEVPVATNRSDAPIVEEVILPHHVPTTAHVEAQDKPKKVLKRRQGQLVAGKAK